MSIIQEFKKFILRGNLVELAVAFIIGAVFAALVKAFIADLITPIIALIFGAGLRHAAVHDQLQPLRLRRLHQRGDHVRVGGAIFFFVVRPMDVIHTAPAEAPTTKECPACTSEIPIKARRCPECTEVLTAAA